MMAKSVNEVRAAGDELKAFNKAETIARARGLTMPLICTHPTCRDNPLGGTVLEVRQAAGGIELVCQHKIRVIHGRGYRPRGGAPK